MRQLVAVTLGLLFVTCTGAPPVGSSPTQTASPAASPRPTAAAVATPIPSHLISRPSGVASTTLAKGRLENIDVTTGDPSRNDVWHARISAKGASDLEILQNTIAPGGTFGWHSHPGPSLVIVKSGAATFYLGNDPTCKPYAVPTGSGFVDQGGDVHVVRNEGTVDLVVVVASLIPAGATRRIDAASPGNCPF